MREKKAVAVLHICNIIFLDICSQSTISCSPYYSLITPKVLDVINLSFRLTPDDTLFTIGRVSPFPPSMICCELKS